MFIPAKSSFNCVLKAGSNVGFFSCRLLYSHNENKKITLYDTTMSENHYLCPEIIQKKGILSKYKKNEIRHTEKRTDRS